MTTINSVGVGLSGASGTGTFVGATSPTLVTPTLGVASATSINFGGGALNSYVPSTSWTPTFTFATTGNLSVSYSTQTGNYVKIGNLVIANFNLLCTPTFTTSSGAFAIGGLPYSSISGSFFGSVQQAGTFTYASSATFINCTMGSSASINITFCGNGVNSVNASTTAFTTGSVVQFVGTISYITAS